MWAGSLWDERTSICLGSQLFECQSFNSRWALGHYIYEDAHSFRQQSSRGISSRKVDPAACFLQLRPGKLKIKVSVLTPRGSFPLRACQPDSWSCSGALAKDWAYPRAYQRHFFNRVMWDKQGGCSFTLEKHSGSEISPADLLLFFGAEDGKPRLRWGHNVVLC